MFLLYVLEGARAQLLLDVLVLVYVVKHYCTVIICIATTFIKTFIIHTTAEPQTLKEEEKEEEQQQQQQKRKEEEEERRGGRRRKRSLRLCTGVEDECLLRDV